MWWKDSYKIFFDANNRKIKNSLGLAMECDYMSIKRIQLHHETFLEICQTMHRWFVSYESLKTRNINLLTTDQKQANIFYIITVRLSDVKAQWILIVLASLTTESWSLSLVYWQWQNHFTKNKFKVLAPGSLTLEWLEPLWNVLSDKVFVM